MNIGRIVPLVTVIAAGLAISGVTGATGAWAAEADQCRYQPSFHCALADDEISRAICTTNNLITLDCALGYAYQDAKKVGGEANVKKEQIAWIVARKKQCGKTTGTALASCIQDTTFERLQSLIERYHLAVEGKVYGLMK